MNVAFFGFRFNSLALAAHSPYYLTLDAFRSLLGRGNGHVATSPSRLSVQYDETRTERYETLNLYYSRYEVMMTD